MNPPERSAVVAGLRAAVIWLLDSGAMREDGGLRSIYRPAGGKYLTYGGGLSCLQCTAGGVISLLAAAKSRDIPADLATRCSAAARKSAGHILGLVGPGPGPSAGSLPCGLEAGSVKTLHTEAGIRAMIAFGEATGEEHFVVAAASAARWALVTLQERNGSFRSGTAFTFRSRLRTRLAGASPMGAAAYVVTLRKLANLTGETDFGDAAERLFAWLRLQQDEEGGFPMYRYGALTRLTAPRFNGGSAEILSGCLRYHPNPNAWMIEASRREKWEAGARRVSEWFVPRIGPNGLTYQYYFRHGVNAASLRGGPLAPGGVITEPYGLRSVEEDVMPTASLGLQWLMRPDLVPQGRAAELLARIASGVLYAQVTSGDSRSVGGIRGLPLHPVFNNDIYVWDTVYGVLFLAAYLEKADADPPAG